MKVLVIGYVHPKNDKRVFRTVKTLSKCYSVAYQYWTDKDEKEYEEDNIKYIPIKYEKGRKGNVITKYFRRRALDNTIYRIIKEEDYDILYLHYFLVTKPMKSFKLAKRKGKKIVYDIHEHHPQDFLSTLDGVLNDLKVIVLSKIFRKQLELSDLVIFVSKEMLKDVLKNVNVDERKTIVVPNYASIIIKPEEKKKKKEITFVGKDIRNFGNENQLLKSLIKYGFSVKLVGMEADNFSDLPHVHIPFLPYIEMMEEISKAYFSLISYDPPNSKYPKNYTFALPNKFFDSIAAGTPVIVKNSFVSMANIVEKFGVGIVIDPSNLEESIEKILKCCENYSTILKNIEEYQELFVWNNERENEFLRKIRDI